MGWPEWLETPAEASHTAPASEEGRPPPSSDPRGSDFGARRCLSPTAHGEARPTPAREAACWEGLGAHPEHAERRGGRPPRRTNLDFRNQARQLRLGLNRAPIAGIWKICLGRRGRLQMQLQLVDLVSTHVGEFIRTPPRPEPAAPENTVTSET